MIHEILTNSHILAPQMDYLIWLQNIRTQTGGSFDTFFLVLTSFGEFVIPIILMAIVYWCIDTTAGIYLLTLNSVTLFFGQLLKMLACVNRPWIINSDIQPCEKALLKAGGFSFPSGHSMIACASWGGVAYLLRKSKLIVSLLVLLILGVGFSRNYLGVHTPQDIIFGFLVSTSLIFVIAKFIKWCEEDKKRYMMALLPINIIVIVTLIYISFKTYYIDVLNGKPLVNVYHSIYITILHYGWILGIIDGLFVSRRFLNFDAKKGGLKVRILRGIIGSIFTGILFYILEKYFFLMVQDWKYTLLYTFFMGFFITAIYPFMFVNIEKKFN